MKRLWLNVTLVLIAACGGTESSTDTMPLHPEDCVQDTTTCDQETQRFARACARDPSTCSTRDCDAEEQACLDRVPDEVLDAWNACNATVENCCGTTGGTRTRSRSRTPDACDAKPECIELRTTCIDDTDPMERTRKRRG